jgi:hypothetical protein
MELVGFENLPNAYIKSIQIFDYDSEQIEIKVSIRLHDLGENSVWYDTVENLTQLLRVGVVMSTNEEQSDLLNSGDIPPLSLEKMTKAIPSPKKVENNLVFDLSFQKLIAKNTEHLNIYTFCFIDRVQVLETFGFQMTSDYYGPIKSEKVFSGAKTVETTTVFTKKNGEYWSGPVHSHSSGFMVGSYHTSTPHERLTRTTVPNTKIKDFRETSKKHNKNSDAAQGFISDLSISYNSNTDINSVFMINVKTLLKNKTKYGSFLNRAPDIVVSQIIENFKINLMTIQRQRVKQIMGSTRLGSKRKSTQSVFSKKNIIKSHDSEGKLKNMTRLERRSKVFDVIESELRVNTASIKRKRNEIFKDELVDYKKISMIQELFLDYGNEIRTFQLNDYELNSTTPGEYKYSLSFHFSDPVADFLISIANNMKLGLSQIKKYVGHISRLNAPREETQVGISSLVNSYVLYYSYVYELSESEKKDLSFKMFSMLSEDTATLRSVKKFEKNYSDLYSDFLRFLDFDKEKQFSKKTAVSVKSKQQTSNRIFVEKIFDKIIKPSTNFVGFSYVDDTKINSMKIFSKVQLQQRAENEIEKHFDSQPNSYSPDLDSKTNAGINDITKTSTAYYGPIGFNIGSKKFGIGLDSKAPYSSVNLALKTMASKKISFVNKNPRISFNKPTVSQNKEPEDTGERFVNSSKIIGSNHEFVNYTEVADSYNIVELETNSSQKYDNSISGFTKNRTFEVTLENVKKLSENQAAELPNQLKAVIAGETDSTKTNYRTEFTDLLANPKTKNYYEINNFSVQQLIYIDRFEKDNNDNIILNKPVYKLMNFENFRNVNKPVFCFFQNYTNNSFGITDENRVSVMDSSFILSDRDITTKINQQVSSDIPIYSRKDIGYQFMNSNIVKQTNQPVNVEIQQLDTTRATSLELEMRLPVSNNISTLGTY